MAYLSLLVLASVCLMAASAPSGLVDQNNPNPWIGPVFKSAGINKARAMAEFGEAWKQTLVENPEKEDCLRFTRVTVSKDLNEKIGAVVQRQMKTGIANGSLNDDPNVEMQNIVKAWYAGAINKIQNSC